MHRDQAEGWEEEREPEARPFHWDTKDGVPCTCLPQVGSVMAPAPGRALHHAGGTRRGAFWEGFPGHRGKEPSGKAFPGTGEKKGEENKYEKQRRIRALKQGSKAQSEGGQTQYRLRLNNDFCTPSKII